MECWTLVGSQMGAVLLAVDAELVNVAWHDEISLLHLLTVRI